MPQSAVWQNTKSSGKVGITKLWGWADRLSITGAASPGRPGSRVSAESLWPGTLDKESEKAARILRSFCLDGFYNDEDPGESPPSQYTTQPQQRAQRALQRIPPEVLRHATGICVFTVLRGPLWLPSAGPGGSGVLLARLSDGTWSPPSAVLVQAPGLGFLVGVDAYDVVLVINDSAALDALSASRAGLSASDESQDDENGKVDGDESAEAHTRPMPGPLTLKDTPESNRSSAYESTSVDASSRASIGSRSLPGTAPSTPDSSKPPPLPPRLPPRPDSTIVSTPTSPTHKAPIYSYLKARRNVINDVRLAGTTVLLARADENARFYGLPLPVSDILGGQCPLPPTLRPLYDVLKAVESELRSDSDTMKRIPQDCAPGECDVVPPGEDSTARPPTTPTVPQWHFPSTSQQTSPSRFSGISRISTLTHHRATRSTSTTPTTGSPVDASTTTSGPAFFPHFPRSASHSRNSSTATLSQPSGPNLFGVPSQLDPDPFGVLALQRAGLDIRESGSRKRPISDQFAFAPSPSSPIFPAYSRKSTGAASSASLTGATPSIAEGRTSMTGSVASSESAAGPSPAVSGSVEKEKAPMVDMCTQTEFEVPSSPPALPARPQPASLAANHHQRQPSQPHHQPMSDIPEVADETEQAKPKDAGPEPTGPADSTTTATNTTTTRDTSPPRATPSGSPKAKPASTAVDEHDPHPPNSSDNDADAEDADDNDADSDADSSVSYEDADTDNDGEEVATFHEPASVVTASTASAAPHQGTVVSMAGARLVTVTKPAPPALPPRNPIRNRKRSVEGRAEAEASEEAPVRIHEGKDEGSEAQQQPRQNQQKEEAIHLAEIRPADPPAPADQKSERPQAWQNATDATMAPPALPARSSASSTASASTQRESTTSSVVAGSAASSRSAELSEGDSSRRNGVAPKEVVVTAVPPAAAVVDGSEAKEVEGEEFKSAPATPLAGEERRLG